MSQTLTLWRHVNLATLDGPSSWGWIEQGAMLTAGETLLWVGTERALPSDYAKAIANTQDLGGALVTPGLIDCHTHLVYGGQRAAEFEMRLQGASYEAIARSGGGIRKTVADTRTTSDAQLLASALRRAQCLMREGVTTLEIKSGYGLSLEHEARCARPSWEPTPCPQNLKVVATTM